MITFIIVLVLGIILLFFGTWYDSTLISAFGGVFIAAAFFILFEDKMPQAIDVYRGKTTLEITYRNGVPVDSVVVFKTEKK